MKTEIRFDRAELRKPRRTPQGFLEADGVIARPGIYEYRRADGTIWRELRTPEVLAASLPAYDAISVTNGHPRRADGEPEAVTADNVRQHEVGTVRGPARMEDGVAVATLVIKDAKAIGDVERGRRELSPGYEVDIDEVPGADKRWAYPGNPTGRWDAIVRRIGPNHLAFVDHARGGQSMRLRMDEAERVDGWGEAKLTTLVAGHQHLIDRCGGDGAQRTSGSTSWAVSEGAESGHSHDWVIDTSGKITIGASEGHTHEILSATARQIGDRVRSLVDHMPGMAGETGVVAVVNPGSPATYGIRFDNQAMFPGIHKWLAENEITDENSNAAPRADAEIDRSAPRPDCGRMADTSDKQRADELAGECKVLQGRITELEGIIAAGHTAAETEAVKKANLRADELSSTVTRLEQSLEARVAERTQLLFEAASVLGPTFRADGMNDRLVRETVVKRLDGSVDVKAPNDDELRGIYRALIARSAATAASHARVSEIIGRTDASQRVDEQAEREKRVAAHRDQWRQTLTNGHRTATEGR